MRHTQTGRSALSSIFRNRLRTALTMLGLVIGISSVIVLVGLGDGSNRQVEERMKSLGGDIVSAYVFDDKTPFTYEDVEALRKLSALGSAAPSKLVGGTVTAGREKSNQASIEATDESYLQVRNLKLGQGRALSSIDRENRSNVCVIGSEVARDLFRTTDCLGNTLKIAGVPFTIVGVLGKTGQTMGLNADGLVMIPFTTASSLGADTTVDTLYARPSSDDGIDKAKQAIGYHLTGVKGLAAEQFIVMSQDEMLGTSEQIDQTMGLLLGGIASISLIVAGIGVMNVMLVSVTERTREIGIKKALGARRSDILSQFLVEALLLSLIGGLIGVAAGLATGMLLASAGLAFVPSWNVVGIAVAASTIIGLVFGLFPAYRASRLTPIEALRHD